MRKVTSVRPKELNLFNRDFGNLRQFLLDDLPEDTYKEFILTTITEGLFTYEFEIAKKFNDVILKLLDRKYKQQLEDNLQITILSKDIKEKFEYDDDKRKRIKFNQYGKSIIDITMEVFSSELFIRYLCDEQLIKEDDELMNNSNKNINIKLPEEVTDLIKKVIEESYLNLLGKNKIIELAFIYKVLTTSYIITNGTEILKHVLEYEDKCYLQAMEIIVNRLEPWRRQLFFYVAKSNDYTELEEFDNNFTEKEQEEFKEFLEDNFFTNISIGILLNNAKAITLYYKMPKEQQNIVKNFVVRLSKKIKESLEDELKKFDLNDLESENVSDEQKEIAAKIQLYLINYKWLELFIRDDQIRKGVSAKSWNLYKNVSNTVLTQNGIDCIEGNIEEVSERIMRVQENYSLNNLCEKNFDKVSFWFITILLEDGEITKEQFIKEQLKKGVSMELINLFYALIQE